MGCCRTGWLLVSRLRGHLGNLGDGRGLLMGAQGRGCTKAGLLAFLEERHRPSRALTPYHTQNKYTENKFRTLLKRLQVPPKRGSVNLPFSRVHFAGVSGTALNPERHRTGMRSKAPWEKTAAEAIVWAKGSQESHRR